MLEPISSDGEMSFDLNSFLDRHAKAVHLGTHALWDNRPPMDTSILVPSLSINGDFCNQHLFKDNKTLEGIQTIDSLKDDKQPPTMEKWKRRIGKCIMQINSH